MCLAPIQYKNQETSDSACKGIGGYSKGLVPEFNVLDYPLPSKRDLTYTGCISRVAELEDHLSSHIEAYDGFFSPTQNDTDVTVSKKKGKNDDYPGAVTHMAGGAVLLDDTVDSFQSRKPIRRQSAWTRQSRFMNQVFSEHTTTHPVQPRRTKHHVHRKLVNAEEEPHTRLGGRHHEKSSLWDMEDQCRAENPAPAENAPVKHCIISKRGPNCCSN